MPPHDLPDRDAGRPADLRRVMVGAGWVAAGFVALGTAVGRLPEFRVFARTAVVVMTAVALALWLVSLSQRVTDPWVLLGLLVGAGLLGAAVDRLDPSGPAYILPFMAVAGIGLRLPRRMALVGGGVVVAASAWAEASTSDEPASAALNVAIGCGFLLVAAAFAGANRDAHDRAQELLRLEEQTRRAREEAAVLAERGRISREAARRPGAHPLRAGRPARGRAPARGAHRRRPPARRADLQRPGPGPQRDVRGQARRRHPPGDWLPGTGQIPELVEQARLATGAPVTYTVVGDPVLLSPENGLSLYRAVQEALANVAKHAQGASTQVTLTWSQDRVEVEVLDAGGESAGLPSGGFGLGGPRRACRPGRRSATRPARSGPGGGCTSRCRCTTRRWRGDRRPTDRCASSSPTTRRWSATGWR